MQQSIFKVDFPSDYNLRIKAFNLKVKPVISSVGNTTSYKWEVNNLVAIEPEYLQPPVNEFLPSVLIAPSKFSFGKTTGDLSTWDGYGKFQLDLNKGRYELTESVKQDVHKLTDHLKLVEEKVNVLYDYLQKNTRYISIQLGIGGWQPLPAKFVSEKKYGDCKALSNFMVSILKEAGVKANYVIIKSGRYQKGIHEDFPSPFYFDHVISCVPNGKDTIWLECTSQTESAGYCSYFTGNRKALMITDDGAKVVTTPHYTVKDNHSIVNITAIIHDEGNMTADIHTHLTALQQDDASNIFNFKTQKQKEEYWNSVLDLPTYKASNISYTEKKGRIPQIEEQVTINAENFALITGKRLFMYPNFYTKQRKLTPNTSRKFDIDFKEGFTQIDSILIRIPKGYKPESLPKDVSINNKYGSYSIKYMVKDTTIQLIRTKIQEENRFPAVEYEAICKYFEQMNKADNAKMVFVKEE